MKLFSILFAALLALCVFPGCQSKSPTVLDPAGSYHGDNVLFQTDQAISASFEVLHVFVSWEYNNRALLSSQPEVKHAADQIRQNVKLWRDSALALRDAYAANPTHENKTSLDQIMAIIQAAALDATKYLSAPLTVKTS